MDDSFLVADLDSLDHLDSDVQARLEVEFSSALLELVLKRLSKEVHDHDMELVIRYRLVGSNIVQLWHEC